VNLHRLLSQRAADRKPLRVALISAFAIWSLAAISFPSFGQQVQQLTPTETLTLLRSPHRVESGQKFFAGTKFVGAETCKYAGLRVRPLPYTSLHERR